MKSVIYGYSLKYLGNIKKLDFLLLLSFAVLLIFRIVANYSALSNKSGTVSVSTLILLVFIAATSFVIIFLVSLLDSKELIFLSTFGFVVLLILLVIVLFYSKVNGSSRWIRFDNGLSFQPSEFLKPFLIILVSYLFYSQKQIKSKIPLYCAIAILVTSVILIMSEPDLGQSVQITIHWLFLLFLTGIPYIVVAAFIGIIGLLIVLGYFLFEHVQYRFDSYFDAAAQNLQIKNAFKAIANGGLSGKGPGEGISKLYVPEAQSDFIFVAVSEEFGLIATAILLIIFGFILVRSYYLLLQNRNLFEILAGSGLIFMLILQMLINLGSVLHVIPTKGLTLPFISSGGSSLLSVSIASGMLLSLTRKNYRGEVE